MLTKLRERGQDEKGFTLIELLVVILIIGILAAIALPAFLNQRAKAQDSEAKSAVRTAQTALETFYTDNQTYVGATPAALVAIEPALTNAQGLNTGHPERDRLLGPGHVEVERRHAVHDHQHRRCRLAHVRRQRQGRLRRYRFLVVTHHSHHCFAKRALRGPLRR